MSSTNGKPRNITQLILGKWQNTKGQHVVGKKQPQNIGQQNFLGEQLQSSDESVAN